MENSEFVIQLTVMNSEGLIKTRHLKVSKEQLKTFQGRLNVEQDGYTIIECYVNSGNYY